MNLLHQWTIEPKKEANRQTDIWILPGSWLKLWKMVVGTFRTAHKLQEKRVGKVEVKRENQDHPDNSKDKIQLEYYEESWTLAITQASVKNHCLELTGKTCKE